MGLGVSCFLSLLIKLVTDVDSVSVSCLECMSEVNRVVT
jgi:hypothetical protein